MSTAATLTDGAAHRLRGRPDVQPVEVGSTTTPPARDDAPWPARSARSPRTQARWHRCVRRRTRAHHELRAIHLALHPTARCRRLHSTAGRTGLRREPRRIRGKSGPSQPVAAFGPPTSAEGWPGLQEGAWGMPGPQGRFNRTVAAWRALPPCVERGMTPWRGRLSPPCLSRKDRATVAESPGTITRQDADDIP